MTNRQNELIQHLGLSSHPEGGYYKETYRSEDLIYQEGFEDGRSVCTSILFLLTAGSFSAFHRIDSDELWNFHEGDPCTIHILHQQGLYSVITLGNGIAKGEQMQAVVRAGDWFASETTGAYTLAGCVVAPGFDFDCFEMADRTKLLTAFPEHSKLIERLTR